jgi:hypothetical protein
MNTNGTDVLEKVLQAIREAEAAGGPIPGRPTLVKTIRPKPTEHQVRIALETLRQAGELESPTDHQPGETLVADPPPKPDTNPDDDDTVTIPAVGGDTLATVDTTPGDPGEDLTKAPTRPDEGRLPRPWPLVFIGLAAAVAIWGGWVRLGQLTGFGPITPLPGIANGFTIDTAVVLPVSAEFYSAYALRVLLASDRLSARTRRFARRSFITSLAVGGGAQIASHVMGAASVTIAPWPVTTLVSCVPVLVIGLATGLATLVKRDASAGRQP